MEFKGTKGKWVISQDVHVWCNNAKVSDCSNSTQATVYREKEINEMKANAQLISCAPEMLDMLEKCVETLEFSGQIGFTYLEAKQLIKKATEISPKQWFE